MIAIYENIDETIYTIEGTCIHTIFQPGLNPYAAFSFCFVDLLENMYSIGA